MWYVGVKGLNVGLFLISQGGKGAPEYGDSVFSGQY